MGGPGLARRPAKVRKVPPEGAYPQEAPGVPATGVGAAVSGHGKEAKCELELSEPRESARSRPSVPAPVQRSAVPKDPR